MTAPHVGVPGSSSHSPADDGDVAQLGAAAARLARATNVVVLTGAGVSAESGISTFRGGMDALWKDFDPMRLATPEAFAEDPETVSRWYDWRRIKCAEAAPNPGHLALARLEAVVTQRGGSFTLLTQNVDRLHQRAGNNTVVELHGNIVSWRCDRTGHPIPMPADACERFPIPSPHAPGAWARPDVVWFGEMLPSDALRRAQAAVRGCDVMISVGTSSLVYPAAGFIELARAGGAFVIEVNRERTALSHIADAALRGPSGQILPRLVAQAEVVSPEVER